MWEAASLAFYNQPDSLQAVWGLLFQLMNTTTSTQDSLGSIYLSVYLNSHIVSCMPLVHVVQALGTYLLLYVAVGEGGIISL